MLFYSVVFIKKINPLCLRHWCFPGKFMNFSEAATEGVLWKKVFLKFWHYSQETCRPATLLKRGSNAGASFWILRNFAKHLFWKKSANGCFWFFRTATEHRWTVASVLTLLLSSDNLLTGYEQLTIYWHLSYYKLLTIQSEFINLCLLAKDWFMLHKKRSQDF